MYAFPNKKKILVLLPVDNKRQSGPKDSQCVKEGGVWGHYEDGRLLLADRLARDGDCEAAALAADAAKSAGYTLKFLQNGIGSVSR